MGRHQIQRRGGPGSGPKQHDFTPRFRELSPSPNQPQVTLSDLNETLAGFGFTKYEGIPAPSSEPLRAVTWINDENESPLYESKLYILAPRADDYRAIQQYIEAVKVLLASDDEHAGIRREPNGLKISIHFKSDEEPASAPVPSLG